MMNGFQRISAALKGQATDKVPVMLHNFMVAAKEAGYTQKEYGTDPVKAADALIRFSDKYQLDGILMDIDTATLAGAVGVSVDFPEDAPARCEHGCLDSLEKIADLEIPDISLNEHLQVWLETMRILKAHFGDEMYLRGNVDQAPFSLASMMRTPAEWLMDLVDEDSEESVHKLLEYCTEVSCQFVKLMAGAGAHMVSTGDSPAGPSMISPAMYAKFAMPYENRVADYAHTCGVPYLLHICGDTTVILDRLAAMRVDAIELDYQTDVKKAHELLKKSPVCFFGNVDPSGILARGKAADVRRETQKVLELFSDTPGFVLSSGCALPSTTPEENLRIFIKTARDFR
ncbi:MAG: uroporphyrinogen decarboxylase family protein [Verrucomicrobia bacterium]|nr:uroporphyrinogen decarboxylase family protein [Verrucomicrobiota bacterium]